MFFTACKDFLSQEDRHPYSSLIFCPNTPIFSDHHSSPMVARSHSTVSRLSPHPHWILQRSRAPLLRAPDVRPSSLVCGVDVVPMFLPNVFVLNVPMSCHSALAAALTEPPRHGTPRTCTRLPSCIPIRHPPRTPVRESTLLPAQHVRSITFLPAHPCGQITLPRTLSRLKRTHVPAINSPSCSQVKPCTRVLANHASACTRVEPRTRMLASYSPACTTFGPCTNIPTLRSIDLPTSPRPVNKVVTLALGTRLNRNWWAYVP